MTFRVAITLAIGLLAAPLMAAERTIKQCDLLQTSSSALSGHADLGGGVVSYFDGHFGHGQSVLVVLVESCASGSRVSATISAKETDVYTGRITSEFDVRQDAKAVLRDAHLSGQTVTFDELAQRLNSVGARVQRGLSKTESCGCNRAYPELRGSKQQFEWYNG